MTLRLDEELMAGLRAVEERDGVPVSEQTRRAIRAWLEEKGISVTLSPRRLAIRRKA